jgi:glyoxylase-like metal-dependent hydrolase (beta-lactamase superfamily II)
VRVLALHEDVLVVVSAAWQTTCTLVRSGDEGFVVDSPVLPHELEALPALAAQAQFPVSGLLATHGDWDHLLGRLAFPDAALGVPETTAARLTGRPGDAQRELRAFDDEWYVEGRPPLRLGQVQALPVPGRVDLGERELELHPADGHTDDGMALFVPWAGVLVAGDYLSPVEWPTAASRSAYAATLRRLRDLVEGAERVVPGHGAPIGRERALALLEQDLALVEGDGALPEGRRR